MPKSRTLRKYQETLVHQAIDHLTSNAGLLLEMCVGSGKTLTALVVAKRLLELKVVDRVLILTPLVSIRDQWCDLAQANIHPSADTFPWAPEQKDLVLTRVQVAKKGKDLVQLFQGRADSEPATIATTYDLWRGMYETLERDLRPLLCRTLLIIDEGHHVFARTEDSKETGTSALVHRARDLGAKTIQLTGTPARYDAKEVIFEGDSKFSWSFLNQMLEGFAPALVSQVITVCSTSESDSSNVLIPAQEEEAEAFSNLVKDLEAHRSALSGIRVRCAKSNSHRVTVRNMKAAIQAAGLKVLVYVTTPATSDEAYPDSEADRREWAEDQRVFEEMIRVMKDETNPCSYAKLKEFADVVIFLRKADEGLDIPAFNNMYFWGLPRSLPTIIQVIGRILRWRSSNNKPLYEGYPEEWLNTSRVAICATRNHLREESEAILMHQLGGWLTSIEIGTILSRLTKWNDSLPKPIVEVSRAVREYARDILEYVPSATDYIDTARKEFQSFPLDPLDSMSDKNRQEILGVMALEYAQKDEDCSIPEEYLQKTINSILKLPYRQSPEGVREIAEDISNDPQVQRVIQEFLSQFVDQTLQAQENSFSKWVFDGALKEHYDDLGKRTGATVDLDAQVEKAWLFRKLENRWPESDGCDANKEVVPGEAFTFSMFKKPWKEKVTQQYLDSVASNGETRKSILKAAWFAWREGDRVKFQDLPRYLARGKCLPPLLVYYLAALWVPLKFDWTEDLSLGELRKLGEAIHREAGRPCRWGQAIEAAASQIDAIFQDQGLQAIKQGLAQGTLFSDTDKDLVA